MTEEQKSLQIQLHIIGYNKKGLIGFIHGGSILTYIEKPENGDDLIEQMHIPYVTDADVKAVNKRIKERKKKERCRS